MIIINLVWKKGDGTPFDPMRKDDLESKLPSKNISEEPNWYDFVKNSYGQITKEKGQYIFVTRNGYTISLRKAW